jgi:hypothetical protein
MVLKLSVQKILSVIQDKIRSITKRNRRWSSRYILEELKRYVKGLDTTGWHPSLPRQGNGTPEYVPESGCSSGRSGNESGPGSRI